MKHSLAVDLNGLRFAHPVLAASGCMATGHDVPGLVDLHKLGGVVSRSLTLAPTKGAPTPRAAETPSGLLSAVGPQNPRARRPPPLRAPGPRPGDRRRRRAFGDPPGLRKAPAARARPGRDGSSMRA